MNLEAPNGALVVGTYAKPGEPISSAVVPATLGVGTHYFDVDTVPCGCLHVSYDIHAEPASPGTITVEAQVYAGNRIPDGDNVPALLTRGLTGPAALAGISALASARITCDVDAKFFQIAITVTGAPAKVIVIGAAL